MRARSLIEDLSMSRIVTGKLQVKADVWTCAKCGSGGGSDRSAAREKGVKSRH
jgi:hypothetical protein